MSIGSFMPPALSTKKPFQVEYLTGAVADNASATWDAGNINIPKSGWVIIAAAAASGFASRNITAVQVDNVDAAVLHAYADAANTLTGAMICKAYLTAGQHNFKVVKSGPGNFVYPWSLSIFTANKEPLVTSTVTLAQATRTSMPMLLAYEDNSYGIFTAGHGNAAVAAFSNATPYNRRNQSTNTVVTALREQLAKGSFTETVTLSSGNVTGIGVAVKGK